MSIRAATLNDLPALLVMAQEFIAESDWNWEYDEENSAFTFSAYIKSSAADVLIGDGCLAMVGWDMEFHKEHLGYLSKFYVSKKMRGTGAARELISVVNNWFDEHNCRECYATATAGIKSAGQAFSNLLLKYGYTPCGDTLVRGYNG